MTLFGIDVSEHQDGMSLRLARAEGIEFVMIRTTDGTYKDRCYASHVDDARAARMTIAAYHYLRAPSEGTTITEQVQAAVEVMGAERRYPVWIDAETPAGLTGEDVAACKREFEARGVPVLGVYTYVPYWEGMKGGEPKVAPLGKLWVAAYGQNPAGRPESIYPGDHAAQWSYPLGDELPVMWQFGSRGRVAGFEVDVNAFRGNSHALEVLFGAREYQRKGGAVEKTLPYMRDQVTQDTFYYCGPASAQTILRAATGTLVSENQLARDMGTTVNGTDYIGQVAQALNRYASAGKWVVTNIPNDPPSKAQVETLWADLTRSVDAGFGVAANIVAPPSNYPRPSFTSTQPLRYGGGTVYHYVALMGYATDAQGGRHVWWADSGFAPYGSWVSLEQTASLIAMKGYAAATGGKRTDERKDDDMSAAGDNQIQLRGPKLEGWSVAQLVEAMKNRPGDKGTMVELLAMTLTEVRALRAELKEAK